MHCGTLQAKLDLAEQVLDYSNRNLQLTMEILVGTAKDIEPFLHEQNENAAAISILIEKIREQVESEKERELLDAASAQLARARGYTSLQPLTDGQGRFDAATATANLILPLLLDNNAWKAFIHFLRVQAEPSTPADHSHRELTARTRQLVRAHQEMKSAVAERKRIAERLSQLASIIELSSDAIVIFTLDGTIVSWNAGAESVYGYSASEVLGSPRSVLLPRDRPDDLPALAHMDGLVPLNPLAPF